MLIRFGESEAFGYGGLAIAVLSGALAAGFRGAMIMSGLFALVVGAVAVARGRVVWARLESRARGGVMLGAALVVLIAGVLAPWSSKPAQIVSPASATATTVVPPVSTATIAPPAPPAVPAIDVGMSAHQPSGRALHIARPQRAPTPVQRGVWAIKQCKDKA
jgi:hypothetical protein